MTLLKVREEMGMMVKVVKAKAKAKAKVKEGKVAKVMGREDQEVMAKVVKAMAKVVVVETPVCRCC